LLRHPVPVSPGPRGSASLARRRPGDGELARASHGPAGSARAFQEYRSTSLGVGVHIEDWPGPGGAASLAAWLLGKWTNHRGPGTLATGLQAGPVHSNSTEVPRGRLGPRNPFDQTHGRAQSRASRCSQLWGWPIARGSSSLTGVSGAEPKHTSCNEVPRGHSKACVADPVRRSISCETALRVVGRPKQRGSGSLAKGRASRA
jgi:hypothetical protein